MPKPRNPYAPSVARVERASRAKQRTLSTMKRSCSFSPKRTSKSSKPFKFSKTRAPSLGKKNTLIREGMFPSTSKSGAKSPSEEEKTSGIAGTVQWDVKAHEKPKKKPTLTDKRQDLEYVGSDTESTCSQKKIWVQRGVTYNTKFFCKDGHNISIQSQSTQHKSQFLITYEQEFNNEAFEIEFKVKLTDIKKSPRSSEIESFSIILDYEENHKDKSKQHKEGNSISMYSVTMAPREQEWRIDRKSYDVGSGNWALETNARNSDKSLSEDGWNSVTLTIKRNKLTLSSNSKVIFKDLAIASDGQTLNGKVGASCSLCRAVIKNWGITSLHDTQTYQMPSGMDTMLVHMIESDIIDRNLNVAWDDIAGLEEAKRILHEAVALPLLIPEFFTGIREPWKGVLLYGPPGTGKTMLAKAVASQAKMTFFNCSASTLASKYHGESERLSRVMFQLARHHSPSLIFFDEIDSLMMTRGANTEHEASRRLKSELLSQIDGINSSSDGYVMILATTNKPQDIDDAMRRRLEKRILIPLPDQETRRKMFDLNLRQLQLDEEVSFLRLAEMTGGYSGSDIKTICRDASMMPLRRALNGECNPDRIKEMKDNGLLDFTISFADFKVAINNTKPTVSEADMRQYNEWHRTYGST